MLNRLKNLLAAPSAPQPPSEALSTALLLLELGRADFSFDDVEMARIREVLQAHFALDAAALDALLDEARTRARESVSLHAYVGTLNERLDADGKRALITMLWQVAWADGQVDKYEEHLLRRLVDLLYIPMADYIRAREAVAAAAAARDEPGA